MGVGGRGFGWEFGGNAGGAGIIVAAVEEVGDEVADGLNLCGIVVGNGDLKGIFDFRNQLDGVEAVDIQIVEEVGIVSDLGFVEAEVIGQEFAEFDTDVVH